MSLDHSRQLISDMVADDYFKELLKDPDMRADMERSEQGSKWDTLSEEKGILTPEAAEPERELER